MISIIAMILVIIWNLITVKDTLNEETKKDEYTWEMELELYREEYKCT